VDEIVEDDAAVVHALFGDADDGRAFGDEESLQLLHRPTRLLEIDEAAALADAELGAEGGEGGDLAQDIQGEESRGSHRLGATRGDDEGIDLELRDPRGREEGGGPDEGLDDVDDLLEGNRGPGVAEPGRGEDADLVAAEAFLYQGPIGVDGRKEDVGRARLEGPREPLGEDAAGTEAHNWTEIGGEAAADDHLVADAGFVGHELVDRVALYPLVGEAPLHVGYRGLDRGGEIGYEGPVDDGDAADLRLVEDLGARDLDDQPSRCRGIAGCHGVTRRRGISGCRSISGRRLTGRLAGGRRSLHEAEKGHFETHGLENGETLEIGEGLAALGSRPGHRCLGEALDGLVVVAHRSSLPPAA
jgi:hypothetical protein